MNTYPYYYMLAKTAAEEEPAGKPKKKPQEYGMIDQALISMGLKEDTRPFKFKNTSLIPQAIKNYRSADSKAYTDEFNKANPAKWYHHVEPLARGAAMVALPFAGYKARKHLLRNTSGTGNVVSSLVAGLTPPMNRRTMGDLALGAGVLGSAGVYQFARTPRSRIEDAIAEDKNKQNKETATALMRNSRAMRSYSRDMDLLERVGKPRKGFKDPLTKARHEALLEDAGVSPTYKRNVAFK